MFEFIVLALIFIVIYFIPTFVAAFRDHKNIVAILVLNFTTGWTFVGWIGALVWAFVV